ncbi:alpha/beta fold hydrolase [uncultured Arcticibacterium sp.]|uniref:alpha/beta fold hydrolase n=1 Tax=uncultured Arcticibacterium sp. TaxID=2173042 RepID=UPI0030F64C38
MKLFSRKVGEGKPLIILHGFLGSSDNLFTVSKYLATQGFSVFILDARNHGQSPSSSEHNYQVMADDLAEFIDAEGLENPVILGHSMGGKTVLQYAQKYDNYEKLIIVDIAPKFYPTHHEHIMEGLNAINIDTLKSRKEAEEIFSEYVSDPGERQFILKNIYRMDDGFAWRINIPTLNSELENVGEEIESSKNIDKPVLFIKGSESSYIKDGDFELIQKTYTNAQLIVIDGANHWVHATKPKEFIEAVTEFAL